MHRLHIVALVALAVFGAACEFQIGGFAEAPYSSSGNDDLAAAVPPDVAAQQGDLAAAADLAVPGVGHDPATERDLAQPDLAPARDLEPPADLDQPDMTPTCVLGSAD